MKAPINRSLVADWLLIGSIMSRVGILIGGRDLNPINVRLVRLQPAAERQQFARRADHRPLEVCAMRPPPPTPLRDVRCVRSLARSHGTHNAAGGQREINALQAAARTPPVRVARCERQPQQALGWAVERWGSQRADTCCCVATCNQQLAAPRQHPEQRRQRQRWLPPSTEHLARRGGGGGGAWCVKWPLNELPSLKENRNGLEQSRPAGEQVSG